MLKIAGRYLEFWPTAAAVFFLLLQVITNLLLPNITAGIINQGIAKKDMAYIWLMGSLMLAVALVSWLSSLINVYFASTQSQRLGMKLRRDLFRKVIYLDEDRFQNYGDATLITRTTDDVTQLTNVTQTMLRMMLMAPLMLVGSIFMAYSLDHNLIIVFVVALPLLALTALINISIALPRFRSMQEKIDKINLIFQQGLTGVRVIRAFNRDAYELEKFDAANRDLTQTSQAVLTTVALLGPIMTVILNAANLAIVWFGAQLIGRGLMGMGNLVAFLTYATQILMSFMQLTAVMVMLPRAQVSATRTVAVLNAQDKVLDPDDPESVSADRATLALEAVSFSFENAERPALSHLTFKVSAGESLAIIGGTGSGKSTLVSLMARLMDVTAGVVKFAGLDVRQLPQELLHKEIALTQQKAVLFSGTVSSNLRFGKADATIDEMWAALELAQAADFVRAQGGLEMKVEQDGNNFSGGQRQRLSIARTLIADASVYIFDDSFSALDFVTDGKLRAAIAASPRHRQAIKIIVAQRIATVMTADRILVLEKGLQVGLGSHAELVKSCPQYQDILRSQLSDEDLATMGLPQNS